MPIEATDGPRLGLFISCDAKGCGIVFCGEDGYAIKAHSRAALLVTFAHDVEAGEPWVAMPDGETFYCDDGNCKGDKAWFKCECGEWGLKAECPTPGDDYMCDDCWDPADHLRAIFEGR